MFPIHSGEHFCQGRLSKNRIANRHLDTDELRTNSTAFLDCDDCVDSGVVEMGKMWRASTMMIEPVEELARYQTSNAAGWPRVSIMLFTLLEKIYYQKGKTHLPVRN